MTSIEPTFRRSADEPSAVARTRNGARSTRRRESTIYRWSRLVHKWSGLLAAAWLAMLGARGFLLGNSEWRRLQQTPAPSFLTTPRLTQVSTSGVARLQELDPEKDADEKIVIADASGNVLRSVDSHPPTARAERRCSSGSASFTPAC